MIPLTSVSLRRIRLSLRTAPIVFLPFCLIGPVRADAPSSPAPLIPMDDVILPIEDITPPPKPGQRTAPPTTSLNLATGTVRVTRFKTIHWSKNGDMHAFGNGEMVYTEDATQQKTIITARDVDYVAATGVVTAQGAVRMERFEGIFVGQNLKFNLKTQTGTLTNAFLVGDYYTVTGKTITERPDGTYLVEQGEYTTCIHGRPDYKLRARSLTVYPGKYVVARGLTFYAGGTKLITWPGHRFSLKKAHNAPVPLPGYDKTDGPFIRLHDTPIAETHYSMDYDVRINAYRLPIGLVGYVTDIAPPAYNSPPPRIYLTTLIDPLRGILEQISPPTYTEYSESSFRDQFAPRSTFNAVFQNNQGVYNRTFTDLSLTRAEVAVRFVNILGNRGRTAPDPDAQSSSPPLLGGTNVVLARVPNAPFLLDANFLLSEIHEMPTNVTAGRFEFQTGLASQPLIIGKRISLRAGLSNWFHLYTTGTAHDLTSPEVAMDYVPTRTSRIGVAYRYVSTVGKTPFEFDARDIRNEVRLQYQVSGPWAFGVVTKIDVDRQRDYDTELAILRNFDCMQVGINYRVRTESFNIIFNLLPPTADRARRRLMPINPAPVPTLGLNRPVTPGGLNPNAFTASAFTNDD